MSTMRLLALMAAGGVFACVGLYMMLRPRPEGAAKIELFGLKFESSSAGLLVFVVGAGFLAMPLFVPEKDAAHAAVIDGGSAVQPGEKPPAFRLPQDASVVEQEPNDRAQGANIVDYGQTAAGDVSGKEVDWFVFVMPQDAPRDVSLMVRHVSGGAAKVELFNSNEYKLKGHTVTVGAIHLVAESNQHAQFYARITNPYGGRVDYEVRMGPRQTE